MEIEQLGQDEHNNNGIEDEEMTNDIPGLQQRTNILKTGTNQARRQQGGADSHNTSLYGRGCEGGGRGDL